LLYRTGSFREKGEISLMDKRDAIIVSAVRTPIGDFGGSLRDVLHTKLASLVMDEVCKRVNFPKKDLDDVYREAYDSEFFVRYYSDRIPESKFVADTNFCDIGISLVDETDRIIVVSTICNLGKGASGQAVQNMNVMFGFDEKEGLL
jgi:hypothetical protein